MDAAAKALGMSSSDLRTALQSGQSLSSIATSKGISQDTLVAAMAAAIQQANPNVTADQATSVATAIATRTPPSGARPAASTDPTQAASGTAATSGHHHHHHHKAMAAGMDAAAKTLGMTTTDLTSTLQSGQSLASIASSKGVSQDDLVKAISSALSGADSNLTTAQAGQLATSMVTGTPPTSQNQPWATSTARASSTYSIVA
jgi:uncharacterized protein YidB (DUF937 family)